MSSRRQIYFNASASTQNGFPEVEGLSKFHQSLAGYAPTPLTPLPDLASELGVRAILVKDESNRLGLPSFKVLGASWGCYRAVAAYLDLPPTLSLEEMAARAQEKSITLLAATKGNHGRAVAFMARTLGIEANIFVPDSMDHPTQNRIRSEGAKVTIIKDDYDTAVLEALKVSKETQGALLIQDTALDGYEEVPAWIVDGYSTMMFEIENQLAETGLRATTMITPVGVGSLANTVSTFCKSRETPISAVTVEPDTAACLQDSLLEGKLKPIETSFTIMDGMNCGTVSTTAWPNLQRLVDASITVSCYESHKAVEYLASQSVSAGPCGAASLAALRRLAREGSQSLLTKDSVVVLLSTEGPRDYPTPLDVSPDNAVDITSALTKMNSSNPTLSIADGAGEVQVCDYLQAWFAHRGIESHRVETVPGRPSVVGVLRGTGGGKSLMFNGHIDTVSLASYETDGLSGAVDTRDGKEVVLGRGSLDMKGGLASALAAVSAIKAGSSLRGGIIVAAVSDEEDASQGTRDILAAGWRADAAIIPEPTGEGMAHAHKGFVWVEVDILGVAAHGSDHVNGVDAILHTGRFLQALDECSKKLPVDDVLGPATLHCGMIKGGEEASSYPAKCTITIEFRTVPGQTPESIVADIKSLLQDIQTGAKDTQFNFAEPRATLCRPAHKINADHPFIQKVADCAETVMGKRPVIQSVPFWCDAALLSEAGIPSVVFGPSGHGLHGKEEWVEVESLQRLKNIARDMDDQVVPNDAFLESLQHPQLNERGVTANALAAPAAPAGSWPNANEEEIFFDWDALYGVQSPNFGFLPSERTFWSSFGQTLDFTQPQFETQPLATHTPTPLFQVGLGGDRAISETESGPVLANTNDPGLEPLEHLQADTRSAPIVLPGFNNVAEWLDGAYRPSKPCDHCRRHRLQCLILRRTTHNPNPVPSCSSCVGLFRPCSFGRGEKRQPSGFETLSPVLGHLHGVIEEGDGNGDEGETSRKQDSKETKQFVRKGARVLRDWFYRNEDFPYPSEEEKARLAAETGFSKQRISTWFANARRRHKQQRQVRTSTKVFRAGSPMPTSDVASMTPMERWQASPPDEEPVSEALIREAIATSAGSDGSGRQSQVESPATDLSSGLEGSSLASSLSSFGILASDASDSSSSVWSYQSGEGPLRSRPYCRPSSGRRGGRKRIAEDGYYQCTFCLQSFKKKYDWSRHEKSVHLPLDVWICTPNLSELDDTNLPLAECRFCDHQPPTPEHWESHDFRDCSTKPLPERSFSRKDYLWQHLRKFHGCTRYPNDILSRCGFCSASLPSWSARADHLATHFKEGCRMSLWAGDWGFEDSVLANLRNAVLPEQRYILNMASV
ncbi:hypothetical protein BDW74DRAFT_171891 [Aspergillus multicolor]|uniref:uncharacterized protein n=1 Tax=Aspergillus multicolor TaxID=41759 RepID=UPI003CCD06FE